MAGLLLCGCKTKIVSQILQESGRFAVVWLVTLTNVSENPLEDYSNLAECVGDKL